MKNLAGSLRAKLLNRSRERKEDFQLVLSRWIAERFPYRPGESPQHDQFVIAMANYIQPGENAEWAFVYCTLSVVNMATMEVERRIPAACGDQAFANETLPEGACFVPRIFRKDASTLRVFFASEAPRQREAQTWHRDFDIRKQTFSPAVGRARIETASGTFNMQPRRFYDDAVAQGFRGEP
ncbi:MAG: hypothetical protein SGI92_02365 [Bryobacteraceae bacterium]|nr:hypothetical protein [Bryobacteraceae bacterium]